MKSEIKVGVGAIIIHDYQILLAQRQGSHGANMWGSVGGHMEYGETPQQTVIREAKEELGIVLSNLVLICCLNFPIEDKHYIDLGFSAQIESGVPEIQPGEEHKIKQVKWFPKDNIPENLFPPLMYYLKALETGQVYFEHQVS